MNTTRLWRPLTAAVLLTGLFACGGTDDTSTSVSTSPDISTSTSVSTSADTSTNTSAPISESGPTSGSEPNETSPTTLPPAAQAIPTAGSLDGAAFGEPYLGPLVFRWPQGCAVPVVEEVLKSGRTAVLSYTLGLRPEGQSILVSFDDMTLNSLDGIEFSDETSQAAVASFLLPSFVVDRDGFVTDVVGMDAMIEQMRALNPSGDFQFTPDFAALLEDAVSSKYWDSWAGLWASWGGFEEQLEIGTSELDFANGVAVSDVEMQSLGALTGSLVALRSTITLDGADLALAMGAAVGMVGGGDSAQNPSIAGQRVVTVEVVTDPATLQPTSAFASIRVELIVDGETRSQLEERRWAFDWSGCT